MEKVLHLYRLGYLYGITGRGQMQYLRGGGIDLTGCSIVPFVRQVNRNSSTRFGYWSSWWTIKANDFTLEIVGFFACGLASFGFDHNFDHNAGEVI